MVYLAKTNERLPGIASQKLLDVCDANSEGKGLAVLDKKQHVADGGIWYPVKTCWRHPDAVIVFVE